MRVREGTGFHPVTEMMRRSKIHLQGHPGHSSPAIGQESELFVVNRLGVHCRIDDRRRT